MTKFEYLSVMSQTDSQGCWVEGADSEEFPHSHKWDDESEMWRELGQAGWELVTVDTTIFPMTRDDPSDNSAQTVRYYKRSQ